MELRTAEHYPKNENLWSFFFFFFTLAVRGIPFNMHLKLECLVLISHFPINVSVGLISVFSGCLFEKNLCRSDQLCSDGESPTSLVFTSLLLLLSLLKTFHTLVLHFGDRTESCFVRPECFFATQ